MKTEVKEDTANIPSAPTRIMQTVKCYYCGKIHGEICPATGKKNNKSIGFYGKKIEQNPNAFDGMVEDIDELARLSKELPVLPKDLQSKTVFVVAIARGMRHYLAQQPGGMNVVSIEAAKYLHELFKAIDKMENKQ